MAECYFALRHAHVGFVILSIALFVLRGGLMLVESPHVQSAWLRYPSYAIDTLLLTAALMLTSVVHQYPFGNGWLTMKVALLVAYVMLGSVALKRGRARRVRIAAFAAALLTVGFLVSVARAHHPLGIFAGLAA
jgi:uncharacterized membrane protein SirB2